MDLLAIRQHVEPIAQAAGAALMQFFDQPHHYKTKKTATDVVTEGDLASEQVILPALLKAFPDHHIVSEEDGGTGVGAPRESADYFWYIDPLDGTSNYSSNLPIFCVSIALSDRNMRPLVAVIYEPFAKQTFSAHRGGGVTLNGRPLHVTDTANLLNTVICSGFPYNYAHNPDNNLKEWDVMNRRARAVRRLGSIALELAYVAAGRLDGLWEQWVNPWDVQAGLLLVQEAGGTISDYAGEQNDTVYSGRQVVATNGHIHAALIESLQSVRKGE